MRDAVDDDISLMLLTQAWVAVCAYIVQKPDVDGANTRNSRDLLPTTAMPEEGLEPPTRGL